MLERGTGQRVVRNIAARRQFVRLIRVPVEGRRLRHARRDFDGAARIASMGSSGQFAPLGIQTAAAKRAAVAGRCVTAA